jgi:hypothetical protein
MTDSKIAFRCTGDDGGIAAGGRAIIPWIIRNAATMMGRPQAPATNKSRALLQKQTGRASARPFIFPLCS